MKVKVHLILLVFSLIYMESIAQQACNFNNAENIIGINCEQIDQNLFEEGWRSFYSEPNSSGYYKVPVVLHVLENDNSPNISDQTIIDGLVQANTRFNQYYSDSGEFGDINIEFYLAGIDENGNCHSGIERHDIGSTIYVFTETGWRENFQWDPENYCNIFLAESSNSNSASAASSLPFWLNCMPEEDGFAIQYSHLDEGETTFAHEMGHYLGLYHIGMTTSIQAGGSSNPCWDCQGYYDSENEDIQDCLFRGDRICDTDPVWTQFPLGGSSCDPIIDQCASFCNNSEPMNFEYPKENLMSYYNSCRMGFTKDQTTRMYYSLENYRSNLWQQDLSPSCLWESDDQYITGVSTWPSGNHVINRNLIIKSGSSLTIEPNTTLSFCKDKGIIVQPGATLDLRGTLTSCEGQWKGIEVWGTNNANISFPTPGNGKLITQIGSVIENAGTGILLGGPVIGGNYTNTGGELEAYGTTFINNTKSIRIPPSNLALRKYPADIVNCEFNSDGIFQFHSFIDLRGVQSVDIAGCNFDYAGPAMPSAAPYGYGILAIDASMNLTPNIISGTSGPIADESNFNGLSYGVYIAKVFANRSFTVEKANFTNCYTGIYNGGMNVGKILYNTFNLGSVPDPTLVGDNESSQLGLFLHGNITTLEVQENEFIGDGSSTFNTTGVLADNTGSHIKVIRKNIFENLTISNLATRTNGEEAPEDGRGLRYACNDFGSSQYDVIVPKEAVGGFLLDSKVNELQTTFNEQGLPVSAGNLFSNPDVLYGDFNNEQEDEDNFIDYRYQVINELPQDYLGVNPEASPPSSCESEYCEAPCPPNDDETSITHLDDATEKFTDGKTTNNNANTQYDQGPSTPQDGAQLLLQIATSATQMAEAIDQALYILAANNNPANDPSLLWWIGAQETYMTDVWLAGEYAVRGQWNAAHQVLNNIPNEYSLTINQVSEYQNIVTIFNVIANEDINNLSSPAINALISIRNLDNGNAQLLASNILRLNWEDSSPKYYMPNIGIIRPRNSLSNEILVTTIYPNPVSNKLNVIWEKDNVSSVNFQIHSPNNDSVLSGILKKGEDIDVSNFSNGLYFLSLDFGNGEMSTHKVLIVK